MRSQRSRVSGRSGRKSLSKSSVCPAVPTTFATGMGRMPTYVCSKRCSRWLTWSSGMRLCLGYPVTMRPKRRYASLRRAFSKLDGSGSHGTSNLQHLVSDRVDDSRCTDGKVARGRSVGVHVSVYKDVRAEFLHEAVKRLEALVSGVPPVSEAERRGMRQEYLYPPAASKAPASGP